MNTPMEKAPGMAPQIPAEDPTAYTLGPVISPDPIPGCRGVVVPSAVVTPAVPGYTVPPVNTVQAWTPDGREIWIQLPDPPASPTAQKRGVPTWALTAAVLMPVAAGSTALVLANLPSAAQFNSAARMFWYAFLFLVGLAVLLGFLFLRPRGAGSGSTTATATATARGLFGRASATATVKRR